MIGGRAIRSHRVQYFQTRLAGFVIRTMSSVITVGYGAERRLSGGAAHLSEDGCNHA